MNGLHELKLMKNYSRNVMTDSTIMLISGASIYAGRRIMKNENLNITYNVRPLPTPPKLPIPLPIPKSPLPKIPFPWNWW